MYFLYSEEQFKEKNKVLSNIGKVFVPGEVVINGTRKRFTQMQSSPSIDRFIDTVVVAKGDPDNMIFTKPYTEKRKDV